DKARAGLIANIFIDAAAPTNNLVTNPAALRKLLDSGGESGWRGLKHFVEDLAKNGGLPAQVDKTPFKVGENIATTPGAGGFRNDPLEWLQYASRTAEVGQRRLPVRAPPGNQ